MALTKELMMESYATIRWVPADIKSLHPDWSDEKCADVLSHIASDLEDASISAGWEAIDVLIRMLHLDEDEDEDEV